jgi:hypothetical protein
VNERIRELAEQVYGSAHHDDFKFAELIVQECARIGELKEQGYEEYDPDLSVGWYMKQHFGVE